ncbi:hypothetical protein PO909_019818 [Leuciscus waleckii]
MRPPPKHLRQQRMNRFISRSDDLLALSADDDLSSSEDYQHYIRGTSPSLSSRSAERSLVFNEKAEIFVPREEQCPPHVAFVMDAHPPKGILKHSHQLGVYSSDSLRKSKSAEMLGQKQSRGRSRKPKSMSLDREKGVRVSPTGRATSTSSTSPSSMPPDWKMQLLEEKVKFSQFLDEITYRVMTPANLKLLRGNLPDSTMSLKENQTKHLPDSTMSLKENTTKRHISPQHYEFKDHHDTKQERCRPWDEWASRHSRAGRKSKEARPKIWHMAADSPERVSGKQHADPHQEGARPKGEGPIYSRVGGSNDSEGDDRAPRGVQHQPQLHQLPHVESKALKKDNMDKSGLPKGEIPTIIVEDEKTPLSQVTAFSILSQIKESLSDADRIKNNINMLLCVFPFLRKLVLPYPFYSGCEMFAIYSFLEEELPVQLRNVQPSLNVTERAFSAVSRWQVLRIGPDVCCECHALCFLHSELGKKLEKDRKGKVVSYS